MKSKATIINAFTLLTFLFVLPVHASTPQKGFSSSLGAADGETTGQLMAGGYTDDMPADAGKSGSDMSGKGALKLEDLRKKIRDSDKSHGSSEAPKVSPELMGDYLSGGLTDEFFTDKDKLVPVTHRQLYETAGYLDGDLDSLGIIEDGERGAQLAFSIMDEVYINRGFSDGLKKGDLFIVLHAEKDQIKHPVTKEPIGQKVVVDGIIKVVAVKEKNSKTVIVRAYNAIQRGDKIAPYTEPDIPGVDPDSPVKNKKINGYLVATKTEREGVGEGDVVYLDVGAISGVEPGDVFDIIDAKPLMREDGDQMTEFDKVIGKAKIISAREKTSTAFIFVSKDVIVAGDKVKFSQTRYQ